MNSFKLFLFPPRGNLSVGLLEEWPIYFAGMTRPVEDADGGINLGTYEESEAGIFTVIDPYIGMGAGDEIQIFWNNKIIHELKVKAEEVNERLFFFLPTVEIAPGYSECYYQVTRLGEPLPDDPSVALKLLVKLDLPAGEDEEQHLPWHSHLDLVGLPEDVIDNGVSKDWANTGVPMTIKHYRGSRARDVIWVRWGSTLLAPHVVTQAEAEGIQEIVITALPADILTAGDSSSLPIRYEIHDEVWNWCEKWSKETRIPVDAGASRLYPAFFEDADDGELHLDQLDHQATNLLIRLETNKEFTTGDTIVINVAGVGSTGTAPRTLTEEVTVGNLPYILEFPIPFAFVSLFATGTLDGSYVLRKKDESPLLYSKRTFVKVIGNPALLPAPKIEEVIGAILPGDSKTATVRITYPSLKTGDTINMIWDGTKSDGNGYLYEEPYDVSNNDQQTGFIYIYVMNEHILALINGSLKLYYRVYNDDPADYGLSESDFLRVEVREVPGTLPAPDVEEAKDGVIDPTLVYTQAHVLVKPVNWLKDDILTYHWTGFSAFSSTKGSIPITTLSIDKTARFRVDVQYVSGNIGYPVTVRYTLLHVATGKFSYSAPFEVMVGIPVGFLPAPTVLQAPNGSLNPMDALDGVDIECSYLSMDEALDTLALKWRGTPGAGTSEDREQPAESSGIVTFHLPASFVGANIRRSVDVSHDVQRYALWTSSQVLPLQVLDFQAPEKELPRPEVPQAIDAVLDLMEIAGDASVVVKPWPFIAKGQLASIWLEGRASTGSYVINVLSGHLITDQQVIQGLYEPLLRSELLKLLHSSAAVVKCAVVFDGSTDMSAAIEFPSLPLTIRTRYDYVTPVITKVLNPQGQDIPEAGLTYDKRVTVQGTATRGEKVEIRINDVLKGTPEASALWTWECPADSLTEGLQKITVEALYDADVPVGKPRTFTVGVATKPSITAVNDSKGSVAMDGTTYDSVVTVAVKADPDQLIQLYDSATAIGAPIELDGEGNGSTTLTDLTVKGYALKARALYGQQLESAVHNFAVKAHLAVTLTSVRHSGGELPNGGATTDSSVTLSGTVTPRYEVQIYDNNNPGPKLTGHPSNGSWTTTLGIGLGGHSVYAKALATGQNSNTRTFHRNNPIPPLNFNQNPVTLGGKTYICRDYPNLFPAANAGNSVRHQASGGSGSITYSSSNPAVAPVDGTGFVRARSRGSAVITARDGVGQSKSYTVHVTNVILCIGLGNGGWSAMNANASVNGARIPSMGELNEISAAYGGSWPMSNHHYWSTDKGSSFWPWPSRKTKYIVGGGWAEAKENGHASDGVGIR
ncbi:Ig-like domain-containing protein [Pseudomonas sp. CFBP13508]|uniref:Ig-like domain-containing protein n=1 Tax=Pseudomonas sp. CFBP13508 TaxID=2184009 RepID=UPI0010BF8955|nr:Ig-like domain-containing protein [Pseudomonas sp. CFBP13508]TKJ75260.1 Ig-like domain-containing protein [Pseudomonas sp. CFBP13508]